MSTLEGVIEGYIRKLISPLRQEEELVVVLKKRLTKKEYKLVNYMVLNSDDSEIMESLNLDKDGYDKLIIKLIKKLNQEKLKQELMV